MIRSAANRPDSKAVGTPTPGTVDDPASTTLSIPRTVLAGRNGPGLAEGVGQGERGARRHALTGPVGRIDDVQHLGVDAELRQPVGDRLQHLVGVWPARPHAQSTLPTAVFGAGAKM